MIFNARARRYETASGRPLLHVTPAEVLLSQAKKAENTSPD